LWLRLRLLPQLPRRLGPRLSPEFRSLADTLGIDLAKPAELCHYDRDDSGRYLTYGWFHFVGSVLSGDNLVHTVGTHGTYQFETLVPAFEIGFDRRLSLPSEPFKSGAAVQLDFMTRIPWMLNEPETYDG
jgi:hypothetical protein